MDPQQPPAPGSGDYDFIVNPTQPSKSHWSFGGGSFVFKLVMLIGGGVVLLIIVAVVFNIFFGDKNNYDEVVGLTQTQNEIVRVSTGGSKVTAQVIKNAAKSTQLAVASQQQVWLTYLDQHGHGVKTKNLELKINTSTDKRLATAQQTNTYDVTFSKLMKSQLTAYRAELQTTANHASDPAERTLLEADIKSVDLLLKQWPA